ARDQEPVEVTALITPSGEFEADCSKSRVVSIDTLIGLPISAFHLDNDRAAHDLTPCPTDTGQDFRAKHVKGQRFERIWIAADCDIAGSVSGLDNLAKFLVF